MTRHAVRQRLVGKRRIGHEVATDGRAAFDLVRWRADYQLRPRYKYNSALTNYEKHAPNVVAVPMGQGFIDYRAFLTAMRTSGFKGTIAYEMCSPLIGGNDLPTLDAYARKFIEYTKGV